MKALFNERLKELRLEKGLSQIALATSVNVGKSIISDWETGKSEPVLSNAIKLAKFFGVSLDYLAGLQDY